MKTPKAILMLLFLGVVLSPLHSESVQEILERGVALLGTHYQSGGVSPSGFDCSGFVTFLYRPTLTALPRMSRDMARTGETVGRGDWIPGDLLFYATGSNPESINHVAIWYGQGMILHSISDGPETGVVLTPYDARYWNRRYKGSRRVLPVEDIDSRPSSVPLENPQQQEDEPSPLPIDAQDPIQSPWNTFEGFLRGDYEAWRQSDIDQFETFRRENG